MRAPLPILLALSNLTVASAAAKPLVPNDFAAGIDIAVDSDDAVQTLLLPIDIYRGVTRTDLGDLRVFNGAEEEVPHALRSLAVRAETPAPTKELELFPIRGTPETPFDDLTLHFSRSEAGTVVDIRSQAQPAVDEIVRAYLLVVGPEKPGIDRLRLKWAPAPKDFVARVRVEASDDLASWREVTNNVSVARLAYGGHDLERHTIGLPSVNAEYLRLTWGGGASPFELVEVLAELVTETEEPARQALTVAGTAVPTQSHLFEFDLGGPVPMDRASFDLPERNTLVEASLSSAAERGGPWRQRWSGLLYRVVQEGQEMSSEPIALGATADRYWRLDLDPKGGGLGKGMPSLEAAWLPQQLLFVARGEPPFLLAFGSYKAGPSIFSADRVLALAPDHVADSLTTGSPRTLAGNAALVAPPPPPPWKVYLLWGSLIAGVLLLGLMTVRLIRQLARTP